MSWSYYVNFVQFINFTVLCDTTYDTFLEEDVSLKKLLRAKDFDPQPSYIHDKIPGIIFIAGKFRKIFFWMYLNSFELIHLLATVH